METADKITQTLAKNIALLRRQNGMTQLELAEKLSYSDKAISKWERGEAIPDVIVLVQLSELFNVSLSDLVSTDLSTEKELQSLTKEKKKRTLLNKWIIALMSSGLVWLIATITFVLIELIIPNTIPSFLVFIYAIPVCFIVLLVFSMVWKVFWATFLCVSVLTWTLFTSVFLTLNTFISIPNSWLLFIIPAAFQILVIFWFWRIRATRNPRKKKYEKSS